MKDDGEVKVVGFKSYYIDFKELLSQLYGPVPSGG